MPAVAAATDDDYEEGAGAAEGGGDGGVTVVVIGFLLAMGFMGGIGFIFFKNKQDIWEAEKDLLKQNLRENFRGGGGGGGSPASSGDEGGGGATPQRKRTMGRSNSGGAQKPHGHHGVNPFDLAAKGSNAKHRAHKSSRARREKELVERQEFTGAEQSVVCLH